ncbi:U7 snRNA-associated Sm-like protein LSm11 [Anoplophora glabripennis]|uniref:U7 snRNA-associated Sm-like protein LSm11 n=1 Tax=Anoplophora glabripennis TaxID=217634 RepID=UPI000874CB57|nr:U7 snRNA-associated Sm-like protein LSm11 [Anoplophora glabripennis]
MADQEHENASESSKSDKSEDYDPRLDFFSDRFDPLLALAKRNLKAPDISAKKYDNLAFYESAANKEKNPQQGQQSSKKKQAMDVEVRRKWLPHQMPIRAEAAVPRKTVFSRMETMKGPLALLRTCRDERLQIKVFTRNQKGIRGYCIGYLAAFDKHWNLALEEVFEFWTRPKKRKVPALDSAEMMEEPRKRVRPPRIKITPHETDKKLENCTRNVGQFLMKGEHVALISVVRDSSNKG